MIKHKLGPTPDTSHALNEALQEDEEASLKAFAQSSRDSLPNLPQYREEIEKQMSQTGPIAPSQALGRKARKSMLGLENEDQDICLFKQIYGISIFYCFNIFLDSCLYEFGISAIQNKSIVCAQNKFLVIGDNWGGLYMLFYTLTILVYGLMMYYIFYRLPR